MVHPRGYREATMCRAARSMHWHCNRRVAHHAVALLAGKAGYSARTYSNNSSVSRVRGNSWAQHTHRLHTNRADRMRTFLLRDQRHRFAPCNQFPCLFLPHLAPHFHSATQAQQLASHLSVVIVFHLAAGAQHLGGGPQQRYFRYSNKVSRLTALYPSLTTSLPRNGPFDRAGASSVSTPWQVSTERACDLPRHPVTMHTSLPLSPRAPCIGFHRIGCNHT